MRADRTYLWRDTAPRVIDPKTGERARQPWRAWLAERA